MNDTYAITIGTTAITATTLLLLLMLLFKLQIIHISFEFRRLTKLRTTQSHSFLMSLCVCLRRKVLCRVSRVKLACLSYVVHALILDCTVFFLAAASLDRPQRNRAIRKQELKLLRVSFCYF